MTEGCSENVASCVTCGADLDPERAEKYDYCTRDECRARNAKPLTIVSVGVNKASDQFVVLDERAEEEMASGRYRDPGRTSSGRLGHARPGAGGATRRIDRPGRPAGRGGATDEPAETWTQDEQDLALAYEITGRLPLEEIAKRLGRRQRTVARMLVAAKARWGNLGGA